jgi:hypothetical protein
MKTALILVFLSFGLLSINACKQCTDCTKYPSPDIKLCKKDYASDDSYNQAYRYTISLGYNCSH